MRKKSHRSGTWSVDVKRMSSRLYYLDATGTVTEGGTQLSGATRRAGLIVRCTIERAILGNDDLTRARPLAMRSFIDLSNVIN